MEEQLALWQVIAVVADAEVGKDEVSRFNLEVGKVPWAQPKDEIMKKAQDARARVGALKNDEERNAMLKNIAGELPAGAIREKTLAMMARIMAADRKLDVAERNTLHNFAIAFGIPKEWLAELAAAMG